MFLRNAGLLSTGYMVLYPRRYYCLNITALHIRKYSENNIPQCHLAGHMNCPGCKPVPPINNFLSLSQAI
jgi:hypothetical protein